MAMKKNTGATTLVVSCVMAVLVLLSTMLVRSATQTCDVALQRVSYEQRYRAGQSLAQYGGWLIDAYRDRLLLLPVGTCIEHKLDAWPVLVDSCKATLIIEIREQHFIVTTALVGQEALKTVTPYSRG